MTDLVREVEIVSLPLQFAMIADRAEVALTRIDQGESPSERDKKALANACEFLKQASKGERLQGSATMQGYSPAAIRAYELTEDASKQADITEHDFRQKFAEKLASLSQSADKTEPVESLRTFFHQLAEWCLSQNAARIEGVYLGHPGYAPD